VHPARVHAAGARVQLCNEQVKGQKLTAARSFKLQRLAIRCMPLAKRLVPGSKTRLQRAVSSATTRANSVAACGFGRRLPEDFTDSRTNWRMVPSPSHSQTLSHILAFCSHRT
jgi:hypothetical protein